MASPITSSVGLGSGLQITSIVEALVKSDTAAKQAQITRQTSNNSAMISGIGALRSALTAFQSTMTKLNSKDVPSFKAYAATTANESVVKVSSDSTAVAGTYDLIVKNLATGSKVASQQFADGADSAIGEGELTLRQGDKTYQIKVGDGATLQSVRDQINKELGTNGITANLVNDGGGSRLVLSSSTTGKGSDLSLEGIPELAIDGKISKDQSDNGAGFIIGVAKNAILTIDGLEVESASNTIKNAVSGMTFEVTGASASDISATRITVAANNDGLKASVQSFVDAYNTLQKAVTSLSSTSRDADDNVVLGSLTGDPTTRALLGDIRKVLSEVGGGDQLTSLSQLGINTQKDGTLEFNTTKFASALDEKKLGTEVQELFTGTNGIFVRMNKAIDPYNATDGSLSTRKSNLDATAKKLGDQQESLDRRTESLTEALTKRYVALDTALSKMQAQADQVSSFFEAINAQAKNS